MLALKSSRKIYMLFFIITNASLIAWDIYRLKTLFVERNVLWMKYGV